MCCLLFVVSSGQGRGILQASTATLWHKFCSLYMLSGKGHRENSGRSSRCMTYMQSKSLSADKHSHGTELMQDTNEAFVVQKSFCLGFIIFYWKLKSKHQNLEYIIDKCHIWGRAWEWGLLLNFICKLAAHMPLREHTYFTEMVHHSPVEEFGGHKNMKRFSSCC